MSDPVGSSELGALDGNLLVQQAQQRLADGRRMPSVPRNVDGMDLEKSAEVAQDFEAVFTTQMISQMFKDVPVGMFGGGFGEKIWREHLYDEFGKTMAKGSPLGIANEVLAQILQMQGKKPDEVDRLVNELIPNPTASAAAYRKTVTGEAVGRTEATAVKDTGDSETVLERNRARATPAPVDATPTMAGIVADRYDRASAAPKPRDAFYHKVPDGEAIPTATTGRSAKPDTVDGSVAPGGATRPAGARASSAPVPLFPDRGNQSAAPRSVGQAMLETFRAAKQSMSAGSSTSAPTADRLMSTSATAATRQADGPPVSLVAGLSGPTGSDKQTG